MLTEDQQFELERTVIQWLGTEPSTDDIIVYAAAIQDDDIAVLYRSAIDFLKILFERKDTYFKKAEAHEIVEVLSVLDQIELIANLTEYNPGSVLKKAQISHPELNGIILPADITKWSTSFYAQLQAGLSLLTVREFSQAKLYMKSLENTHQPAELEVLFNKLSELYLAEGSAYDEGRGLDNQDTKGWEEFYTALGFMPQELIKNMSTPDAYFDRLVLNTQLLDALSVLTDSTPSTDPETALWRIMRWRMLRKVLLMEEATRQGASEAFERKKSVFDELNQLWSVEAVRSGVAAQKSKELISRAKIDAFSYFSDSLFSYAMLDPSDAGIILSNIRLLKSEGEVDQYISGVIQNEPIDIEDKEAVSMYLHQVASIIRAPSANTAP